MLLAKTLKLVVTNNTYNTFVTSKKWTASLKNDKNLVPNASVIWRFHCNALAKIYMYNDVLYLKC